MGILLLVSIVSRVVLYAPFMQKMVRVVAIARPLMMAATRSS